MHYFNSSFLRTYYGLGPDTNGDAIVYYCDLRKVLPWGFNQIWLLFIDLVFPFASFSPSPPPLPSLLLHLFLPLRFPTLWGGAGFPAQKLVGFWEESEDLNRDWNQLVCHLIREGETRAKEEGPYARTELAARRRRESSPKGEPEGPVLGIGHLGSPKDRGPPRPPMVGVLGSGPGSGCPGDLSVTIASSKHARGMPDRTPGPPLASALSQIPGFASRERIKTRTGFGQIFLSHHERPAVECTLRGCVPTCFLIISSLGIIEMTHRPLR